jgi:hypothetical protein
MPEGYEDVQSMEGLRVRKKELKKLTEKPTGNVPGTEHDKREDWSVHLGSGSLKDAACSGFSKDTLATSYEDQACRESDPSIHRWRWLF